mgnify:CR=1 FL=1
MKALEDRAPAVTMAAKKFFHGMNSTRHVQLADGTVAGSDWRRRGSPAIGNAGTPDSQMVLVKFAREEEKKDIEAAYKIGTVASKVAPKPDEGNSRKEEK